MAELEPSEQPLHELSTKIGALVLGGGLVAGEVAGRFIGFDEISLDQLGLDFLGMGAALCSANIVAWLFRKCE